MRLHVAQGEPEERLERVRRGAAERQVLGLEMPDRPVPRLGPADEEQGRPELAVRVGGVVYEGGDGVCLAVRTAEGGRPLVRPLVSPERVVRQLRRRDSFTTLPSRNARLAGRSARRRMR